MPTCAVTVEKAQGWFPVPWVGGGLNRGGGPRVSWPAFFVVVTLCLGHYDSPPAAMLILKASIKDHPGYVLYGNPPRS